MKFFLQYNILTTLKSEILLYLNEFAETNSTIKFNEYKTIKQQE